MACRILRSSRRIFGALAVAALAGAASVSRADQLQNYWSEADSASLAADGLYNFINPNTNTPFVLNGTGINVGIVEAGGGLASAYYGAGAANMTAPNANLPNGNVDLPGAKINFLNVPGGVLPTGNPPAALPAGYSIGNHASEVTGVVISQDAVQTGIAPGANVNFAALNNSLFDTQVTNIQNGAAAGVLAAGATAIINDADTQIQNVLQQRSTPIVNMSWGFSVPNNAGAGLLNLFPVGAKNNGTFGVSPFADWAAQYYDALLVVAGNENAATSQGATGTPSDAYNTINVGATGVLVGSGGALVYSQQATYNQSNTTSDGRIKTDIVAPGGDPGSPGALGSFNAPPAMSSQFLTTAGGQVQYQGTNKNGVALWNGDSFTGSPLTSSNYLAGDTNPPNVALNAVPPFSANNNPGANLGGADAVIARNGLAGTSFAAPEVSGAASLIYQLYNNSPIGGAFANGADNRVVKAILLNGAVKQWSNGLMLTSVNAMGTAALASPPTPWHVPAPLPGAKPLVPGLIPVAGAPAGFQAPVQQGLDPNLGTGELDVANSVENYLGENQAPGLVTPIGWNFNTVPAALPANTIAASYVFGIPNQLVGGSFQATLDWDDPVNITAGAGAFGTWQAGATLTRSPNPDLDLYLSPFNPITGLVTGAPVGYSTSNIDNVQHIYIPGLAAGNYVLDVVDANVPQDTPYGLAWSVAAFSSVPEPTSFALIGIASTALCARRRKRVA